VQRRSLIAALPAAWAWQMAAAQTFPASSIRYIVPVAAPVQTVAQFVDSLRKNPASVSYGSAGQGSLTHLTMELFKQAADVLAVHIPYRGIAPAFTDLLGGQTQAMVPGLVAALPHIRSGRARPLAVTGAARHPLLKDVPTMVEAGFKGFDALQWYGVVGPAGLPAPAYVDPAAH
jgi:tripartite-type tricarboxylate transporter receptor subunit TctC